MHFNSLEEILKKREDATRRPARILSNATLSYFDKLGRSVHGVLKNVNDPTRADQTLDIFLPLPLYKSYVKPVLMDLASRTYRLNKCQVHVFEDRVRLNKIIPEDQLAATWGEGESLQTTRVLSTSMYPFNVRCSSCSENLRAMFVANARNSDGTFVLSYTQRLD